MHNLSMVQALSLWSELEAAFFEENRFGGDTAEIYIYRAMAHSPSISRVDVDRAMSDTSSLIGENIREVYDAANVALHDLFVHFAKTRSARIEIEGKELGEWLKTARFTHRIHVKVTNLNKRKFGTGSTYLMKVPTEPVAIGNLHGDVMEKLKEVECDGPFVQFRVVNGEIEVYAVEEDD